MYPTIPVGPLALPTGPFLSIIAAVTALEVMVRYGRRAKLSADELWNVGLVALLTGLVVARLWNVLRFWDIYVADPLLIVSFRPSGFVLLPGLVGGLLAGYVFTLYRSLPAAPVIASAAVGVVAGSVIQSVSGYLTGTIAGLPSGGYPLLNPLDPPTHPAGLYRAVGMLLVLGSLLIWTTPMRPLFASSVALLGSGLVRLVADGFVADVPTLGALRISQLLALLASLVACLLLARASQAARATNEEKVESSD